MDSNLVSGGEGPFQPLQRQLFGDRAYSLPTNGKSHIPQIKGTDYSTIFIAISSYRDVECAETLLEMYAQALNPDRLRVRIVQHTSNAESGDEEVRMGEREKTRVRENVCV